MRTDNCLIFNNGVEFTAKLTDDSKYLIPDSQTNHIDPSNNLTLCFAPIKKTDDLVNMATQMGVGNLQPVITDRTVAQHINWDRIKKIIVEASEQSGRNSIPKLLPVIKFEQLDKSNLVYADERTVNDTVSKSLVAGTCLLIGPEGGFSDSEFEIMEKSGAKSISLGKTILRAETAAVAMLAKLI